MPLAGGVVLAVLAVSPFFRGLFFPGEYLIGLAVVLAACAVYYLGRSGRVREQPLTVLEWAALAFAACYWVVLPLAVVPRAALAEGIKYTSYLAAMWMVSRLGRNSG